MSKRHRKGDYMRQTAPAQLSAGSSSASPWHWRSGAPTFDGSKFRGALRSAYPSGYDLDYTTIRGQARKARWDSAQARSIIRRLVDNVIGTGMSASASPMWDQIGSQLTPEERSALSKKITQQFALYMQSHEPDATGRMTGYELQAFELLNELGDGEAVIIQRFSGAASRMSPVNLQFIDPDQVSNPFDAAVRVAAEASGNSLVDGLEVDTYGKEIAVHVQDPKSVAPKWTRVPVNGPSGRRFVLHPGNYELVGQVRGISILAPIIHDLQKITDYGLAELESAVINAIIAGYEVAGDSGRTSGFGEGVKKASEANSGGQSGGQIASAKIDKPGIWISRLPKGGDIKSFDTKRPNVNYGDFVKAVMRSLAAALSIPIEVLEMSFNANYSASRASLILFWQRVENWRESLVSQFLQPWYDTWFTEAVRAGRFKAPGWGDDPVVRAAWLNVNWIGVSMPSIDPSKDADADDKRITQGATTREQVAMRYNGSNFEENAEKLAIENPALAAANKSMQPPAPGQKPDASKPAGAADGQTFDENGDTIPQEGAA